MTDLASGAPLGVCAHHADAAAVATCDRCGGNVCADCRTFYDYRPLCPSCRERRSHGQPASRRAKWAMALAVLGLGVVVLPFGLPAALLGHAELAAIRNGTAPDGGRGYAMAGVVLGWLSTVFFVVLCFAFAMIGVALWLEA